MKNILKSLFVAVFPVLALISTLLNGLDILSGSTSLPVIGGFVTALPIVVFFAGLFLVKQARTSKRLMGFSVFTFSGLLFYLVAYLRGQEVTLESLAFTIVLVVGWVLYLEWYSKFDEREKEILQKGKRLPKFELEKTDGSKLSSTYFNGSPTIFLFYRGNWCPLCMAQIKEIAGQYKALEERGVQTVMVSPQPHNYTDKLAKKYNLGFHFLQDSNNLVAKQLGIFAENGLPTGFQVLGYDSDTVMPTVIITNAKGVIEFVDLTDNYRVRPEPDTFLKVIDAM